MIEKIKDNLFSYVFSLLLGGILTLVATYFTSQPTTPEEIKRKLQDISKNAISHRYNATPTESKIDKIASSELEAAAEKSIIIVGSSKIEGSLYRWISIFEKESPGTFDKLVGRAGFFKLTSLSSYQSPYENSLQVEKIESMDLDEDGTSEIHLRLHATWADSTSTGPLILKKSSNGQWLMITLPSIKSALNNPIRNSVQSAAQPFRLFGMAHDKARGNKALPEFKEMNILEEVWEVNHNGKKHNLTTLRNGGNYLFNNHSIKGYPQIQVISFFSDGGAVLGPHYAVINMFKIVGHELKTDDLWNWGQPMHSDRPLRLTDIDMNSIYKAGIMAHTIGDVFYGYTEFEKFRENP